MKNLFIAIIVILTVLPVVASPFEYRYSKHWKYVYHKHNESSYQHAYCSAVGGIEEYINSDKTRVDCLTDEYAIEFDFANKWHESIGQALHYGIMTSKKPKVILILDGKKVKEQLVYYYRVKKIGDNYSIAIEYVTDEILNLDEHLHNCKFQDCKCNLKKHKFWLLPRWQ
ncbi:hypothetical protein IKB17_00945 [bacterium]|nr:hypothetical protein [bacterium]